MKDYIYKGKQPHLATLRIIETDEKGNRSSKTLDVALFDGQATSLPEDNEHIKSLVKTGLLVEPNPIVKK